MSVDHVPNGLTNSVHLVGDSFSEPFNWTVVGSEDIPENRLMSIGWDGNATVITHAPDLVGADSVLVTHLSHAIEALEPVLVVHTGLMRRIHSTPERLGLVPKQLDRPQRVSDLPWMIAGNAYLTEIGSHVDQSLWDGEHGFFHPDSDPTAFGTPYLIPVGVAEVRWSLRQVGMQYEVVLRRYHGAVETDPDGVESVAWNDADGVLRLASQCADDPENLLVMTALLDSERVARSAVTHLQQRHTIEARKHFGEKRNQIKPRLTKEACRAAVVATGIDRWRTNINDHSLTPYSIYGYGSDVKQIHAACSLQFSDHSDPRLTANTVANDLYARVRERKLGSVVRISDDGVEHVFVTRDPAALQTFHAAFGLSSNAVYTVVTDSAETTA